MSSSSKRREQHRFIQARSTAYQATHTSLGGVIRSPFRLTEFSAKMEEAWRQQWLPILDRTPPNGGWDWPEVRTHYRRHIDRLEVAIWSLDDRLYGAAVGKTNKTAVVVEALEGDPRNDCPLKGQLLLIFLQAATCYAQTLGRSQLWLMEPASKELEDLYVSGFGFAIERPKGKNQRPFCWREV